MSRADAFVMNRCFPTAEDAPFCMAHHYLLYAETGVMRLSAEGRQWSLPPARAALIKADQPIRVALPQPVRACSALFAPGFVPDPATTLSVFEVTALARELLFARRNIGEDDPLDSYSQPMFKALAAEAWRLACTPSPTSMPEHRTDLVRKALDLTLGSLESNLTMDDLASALATTP